MSRTQEILLSPKNRELLLNAVYSMMGYEITDEEIARQRYKDVVLDLNDILHDVNTDFVKVLQLIQSKSEDLKTVNRQIALKVFERWEHRNESFFLHERRLEEQLKMKRESMLFLHDDDPEIESQTTIKRSEVILFTNSSNNSNDEGSVLDSFHFTAEGNLDKAEKDKDFFGNSKITPRMHFTSSLSSDLNPTQ